MIKGSEQMFCETSIRRAVTIHYQRNTLKTTGTHPLRLSVSNSSNGRKPLVTMWGKECK